MGSFFFEENCGDHLHHNWNQKTNKDLTVCMLLVVLSQFNFCHSAHVSGIITENVTFFYRKLPVTPSVRATIEFSVSHQIGTINYKCPSMGIYTKYPTVNIEKRCSDVTYGQLRNENLHPHLKVGTIQNNNL